MRHIYTLGKDDWGPIADMIITFAHKVVHARAFVVQLEGDIGAGKTTLVQTIALRLGARDQVVSPTFVLKREYHISHTTIQKLVHIDAYRFNDKDEGRALALEYDMEPGTMLCIEWPGNMHAPEYDVHCKIGYVNDHSREIIMTTYDN